MNKEESKALVERLRQWGDRSCAHRQYQVDKMVSDMSRAADAIEWLQREVDGFQMGQPLDHTMKKYDGDGDLCSSTYNHPRFYEIGEVDASLKHMRVALQAIWACTRKGGLYENAHLHDVAREGLERSFPDECLCPMYLDPRKCDNEGCKTRVSFA